MKKPIPLRKYFLLMILPLVLVFPARSYAQEKDQPAPPRSIEELKVAIEKVMEETKTPAAGIAIVNKEGPVWVAGLGKADIERDVDATENTMFRIGSVSKMYVALSVLKLQEEGRISLHDKVRDLVPEIWFENKWEDTNPVLVEHLLEHTTGWDDFHMAEYAHNDPDPISLLEGLNYHPHSRTSRWIPGTRMAYCNSGPPVAAYIVEKITGESFEDYVGRNFFEPMGMENITYFATDTYRQLGATLYQDAKPQKYWHILMRPSGSINASPKDMAKMVLFFVNRGRTDSVQLISASSLKRMESSSTTTGSKAGIEVGYGLHNYTSPYKSFIYRSHDGGVNGGLTDLSYLPEFHVGYAFMMNSGNYDAFLKISKLIRDFQTRDFDVKEKVPDAAFVTQHAGISGYYLPVNPRSQMFYFLEKIVNVKHIRYSGDSVFQKGILGGETSKYLPANEHCYRSAETGLISMVRVNDPLEGEVIQSNWTVLRKISMWQAYGQLVVSALWVILMLSAVIFGLIWPVRLWRGKIGGGARIWIRFWPLLASLFFLTFLIITGLNINSLEIGQLNTTSLIIMLATIGFAITSAFSAIYVYKVRNVSMNRMVYWHSAILSGLHLVVTGYLLWYGVIGIRLWA